ncbi:hypothetical protein J2Z21_007202 [Streptomyces griseochromogenes]|uniref:Ig-like domain-containing protein n=2 Tax=Streptomyces griseochromogenes TaxID=68214 RepID=A0ABS4M456_9ACTN|nr:hypothetical protein [Streptomyces griseochromogenes]MBP2054199.1 hypothetical protein [Streptomyces griseochromogenes]
MSLIMVGGLTTGPAMADSLHAADGPKFVCKASADRPHWSKGAKSVIYKTRVECAGSVPTIKAHCKGHLMYSTGEAPSTAATSSETRSVKTDGTKTTFYTPEAGGKKVNWSGNFQGSTHCTSPGTTVEIGDATTPVVKVKVP